MSALTNPVHSVQRYPCPRCGTMTTRTGMGGHARYCEVTQEQLFWTKVDKSAGPDACWPWTGAITTHRYGCVQFYRRVLGAHKVAYLLAHGPVPDGLQIRHSCDNPPCCNPAHLSLGTRKDNAADKVARGRTPKTMTKFLTVEQVREIRAARGRLSSGDIAKQYGITQSYAFTIWAGKVWRNA